MKEPYTKDLMSWQMHLLCKPRQDQHCQPPLTCESTCHKKHVSEERKYKLSDDVSCPEHEDVTVACENEINRMDLV